MVNTEEIRAFAKWFAKQPTAKNGMMDFPWLSGCSTKVHPITVYLDEANPNMTVQWRSRREPKKLIEKSKEKYSDLIKSARFCPSDGTCPSEIIFTF